MISGGFFEGQFWKFLRPRKSQGKINKCSCQSKKSPTFIIATELLSQIFNYPHKPSSNLLIQRLCYYLSNKYFLICLLKLKLKPKERDIYRNFAIWKSLGVKFIENINFFWPLIWKVIHIFKQLLILAASTYQLLMNLTPYFTNFEQSFRWETLLQCKSI